MGMALHTDCIKKPAINSSQWLIFSIMRIHIWMYVSVQICNSLISTDDIFHLLPSDPVTGWGLHTLWSSQWRKFPLCFWEQRSPHCLRTPWVQFTTVTAAFAVPSGAVWGPDKQDTLEQPQMRPAPRGKTDSRSTVKAYHSLDLFS